MRILHADHGLSPAHLALIPALFTAEGFAIHTIELSDELPSVPCGLYGPTMGDEPVTRAQWAKRGDRPGLSRLIHAPLRESRRMTVIGAMFEGALTVYTAFGGPLAPREVTDPTLPPEAAEESIRFWATHALAIGD